MNKSWAALVGSALVVLAGGVASMLRDPQEGASGVVTMGRSAVGEGTSPPAGSLTILVANRSSRYVARVMGIAGPFEFWRFFFDPGRIEYEGVLCEDDSLTIPDPGPGHKIELVYWYPCEQEHIDRNTEYVSMEWNRP